MIWYRREKLTYHLRELAAVSVVLEAEAMPHHVSGLDTCNKERTNRHFTHIIS